MLRLEPNLLSIDALWRSRADARQVTFLIQGITMQELHANAREAVTVNLDDLRHC